ncbi:CDP-alcohol phosphatidyltransferase family protein [Desulfococcus multivorans]|nr:CDP-alcohol phosphatidyltransferase family protein [Desulfococcus multivorans]
MNASAMDLFLCFVGKTTVRIWGLTPRRRIFRVLSAAGFHPVEVDPADLRECAAVLLFRGDYLIDDRLVKQLARTRDTMLQIDDGGRSIPVAAHVSAGLATRISEYIETGAEDPSIRELRIETPESLSLSFQAGLLKFDPPFVLQVSAERRHALERRLFDWSYKGVTDVITKWVWPVPARWTVGCCVRWGIRPNHVTAAGLVLVVLAGGLFACGQYGWGLVAGWLMTFLDTVDGKLARVTVASSRFGHYFDHLIDLIHPPVWYMLWGIGLTTDQGGSMGVSMTALLWLIVVGYASGRLAEGLFQWVLGQFGIFCWRPVDSFFRLVTARRNPNLFLLTMSVLAGRPEIGLLSVAVWTVVTSLFLWMRLVWAAGTRIRRGPLVSWFTDADRHRYDRTLAWRLFTGRTTG